MKPEVSVVAPVYRSEEYAEELCNRLTAALQSVDSFELLLVDDASPGRSRGTLKRLAETSERVEVIELDSNRGQHAAVLRGLSSARGGKVVVIDADLQDPPEAVPRLLQELSRGFDVVFGGRRGRYESPVRLATSRVFKWLLHKIAGVPQDAGMFMALSRAAVDGLLTLQEQRPFVVEMIGRIGLPMTSVPVERQRRADGTSAYSSIRRSRVAASALRSALRHRRIRRRRPGL